MTAPEASFEMPTFPGVLAARRAIAPHLRRTPLYRYPALRRATGTETWVKHENHQPVGAFKVRGGVNLVSRLSPEERERGLAAASTGNHGQSIAFAARRAGVQAVICVPEKANPVKLQAMEDLGATIVLGGKDFDEARERCERLALKEGYRYVHSGNEPLLVEGVGTYALEILEDEPSIDVIIVPVGGGSGAAGTCLVAKTIAPRIRVIGVQAEAAPAAYLSWKHGKIVEDRMGTAAEGLATRVGFELPQTILGRYLDDFILVSEDEIRAATLLMIEATRNLAEGAGAAPLAAARKLQRELDGLRVALVLSGGNISPEQLAELFTDPPSE